MLNSIVRTKLDLYPNLFFEDEIKLENSIVSKFIILQETKNKSLPGKEKSIKELCELIDSLIFREENIYISCKRESLIDLSQDEKNIKQLKYELKNIEFAKKIRANDYYSLKKIETETDMDFLSRKIHIFIGYEDDGTKYF